MCIRDSINAEYGFFLTFRYNMATQLTKGAILGLTSSSTPPDFQPKIQFLNISKLQQGRWKCDLSDGEHSVFAVFRPHLTEKVEQLRECTISKLTSWQLNKTPKGNKHVIIILEFETIMPFKKIGNPVPVLEGSSGSEPVRRAPAAPSPQRSSSDLEKLVCPINVLNPYMRNWRIKARIADSSGEQVGKSGVKYMNLRLVDTSGEIRATLWKEAVIKHGANLTPGAVCFFGKGTIKFSTMRGGCKHNCEVQFDEHAEIIPTLDDPTIPNFLLHPIQDLASLVKMEKNAVVDIVGVITELGTVTEHMIQAKQTTTNRLDFTVADTTATVQISLWGEKATEAWRDTFSKAETGQTLACKSLKIFCREKAYDDGRRSLTAMKGSSFVLEPTDVKAAAELSNAWPSVDPSALPSLSAQKEYTGGGGAKPVTADLVKNFADVDEDSLVNVDDSTFCVVRGSIIFLKTDSNPWYNACPGLSDPKCQKKLDVRDGGFYCGKCQTTTNDFRRRYILSLRASDHSGTKSAGCFNDVGEKLLGISADDLFLKQNNEDEYAAVFQNVMFRSYEMKFKVVRQLYMDATVLRWNLLGVAPIDFKKHSGFLLQQIKSLHSQPPPLVKQELDMDLDGLE
eukprot:TRINITY_DN7583_c0_g1_i1.p1 TRINITY_DN7583_c0_g1~~TRINITY_DN7583_c0_g1_i1.p1  ORF type:complete len:624 (+),score=112.17 TRINITY_DN7583_c0_g1_i1:27-1898(+)